MSDSSNMKQEETDHFSKGHGFPSSVLEASVDSSSVREMCSVSPNIDIYVVLKESVDKRSILN